MNIFMDLIVFAVDMENSGRSYTLLFRGDILTQEIMNNSPTIFDMVKDMLKRSMNITGTWLEATPKLIGVLDDKFVDSHKQMHIIYSLHIPCKNSTNEGYEWVDIKDLEKACDSEVSKDIIRYAQIYSW